MAAASKLKAHIRNFITVVIEPTFIYIYIHIVYVTYSEGGRCLARPVGGAGTHTRCWPRLGLPGGLGGGAGSGCPGLAGAPHGTICSPPDPRATSAAAASPYVHTCIHTIPHIHMYAMHEAYLSSLESVPSLLRMSTPMELFT